MTISILMAALSMHFNKEVDNGRSLQVGSAYVTEGALLSNLLLLSGNKGIVMHGSTLTYEVTLGQRELEAVLKRLKLEFGVEYFPKEMRMHNLNPLFVIEHKQGETLNSFMNTLEKNSVLKKAIDAIMKSKDIPLDTQQKRTEYRLMPWIDEKGIRSESIAVAIEFRTVSKHVAFHVWSKNLKTFEVRRL